MRVILLVLLVLTGHFGKAQKISFYPSEWWVGMKNPALQLLIHADAAISGEKIAINYPGVSVKKITALENKHYLVLDLQISKTAKPGSFPIKLSYNGKEQTINYELKSRNPENGKTRVKGVTAADLVYLLMPDRFSNGDPSNDVLAGMRDTIADRKNMYARHGGDLKGVQDHLGYFNELGVTAIWMTPVLENNMPLTDEGGVKRSTYHGYAFTDHYTVDARFGGNKAYRELITEMHAKGLKIIQDAVYNHVGEAHWFVLDPPSRDWFNQWPNYTQTSYKDQPLIDPYASKADKDLSARGWFTKFMPDLNQRNPFVANFLIQHAIWCTEYFGIDGWRVDTYFYSDAEFLNRVNSALMAEFPTLTVFGEAWVHSVTNSAYFCQNTIDVPFKHNLQGVTDFPLHTAFLDGVNQPFGWTDGVNRVYMTLAQDILYKDPMRNSIFLDNHDLNRVVSMVGEDMKKLKMALAWLLTQRGIPQLYYGTEILMKNFKDPSDAKVREDFPGGWKEDATNKFLESDRTAKENEIFGFIKKLAAYRKATPALATGKLMQYVPDNGAYVYFRYNNQKTIMVAGNTGKDPYTLSPDRFAERTKGFTKMTDIISGETVPAGKLILGPMEVRVFELKP